jgi:hypothetical protein
MALSFTNVENPNELNTSRASTTIKTHGATTTYTDNTGSATTDYAYHGGASNSYTMMETKSFNPNNASNLTQNDSYTTVGHDAFSQVRGMKETRVFGDFNIITGSPNFFTDGLASAYVQKRSEIPAGPEMSVECQGNVSGAKYQGKGKPDPKSGSTVGKIGAGGSKGGKTVTTPEPAAANMTKLLPEKQTELSKIERNMGNGGSIKLQSCKHIIIQAGAAASTMDSAVINKKGRQYPAPFKTEKADKAGVNVKQGKGKPSTKITDLEPLNAGPQVEEVNTTSNMPFGNIDLRPGNQFSVAAGTGGLSLISGGSNKITGLGNTLISSPGVLVQGSQTVDVRGTSNVNIDSAGQVTVDTPNTIFTQNIHVYGNAIFKGNVHIEGTLTVKGLVEIETGLNVKGPFNAFNVANIKGQTTCNSLIKSDVEVQAKSIKLTTHKHREQGDGAPTSKPM